VLRLRDLIFYGIVIIQPIAPVPIFGVTQKLSMGFAVTAVAISGIAMMLTAFSYGRLAALYPTAGSAYSYVGRGLNPHLGFLAGWAMALDYLVLPIVAIIQAALAAHRLVPMISYTEWAMAFVALLTAVTLWGIRATARVNIALLACMFLVCGAFVYLALLYLGHQDGVRALVSIKPFYDPATFDWRAVSTATAFAALTYIGFDGVTTLAEDVENPRRNVLIAIVSVCALTTLLSCLLVYLAQRVWPDYHTFANIETAFMDVTRPGGRRAVVPGHGRRHSSGEPGQWPFGGGGRGSIALCHGTGRGAAAQVFRLHQHDAKCSDIECAAHRGHHAVRLPRVRSGEGRRSTQLRGFSVVHGGELGGHSSILLLTAGFAQTADIPGSRGPGRGISILPGDVDEPAHPGKSGG